MSEYMAHALGVLTTVYVTCCFVYLDGPFDVFMRLRGYVIKRGWWKLDEMLNCSWCTGFWAAIAPALLVLRSLNFDSVWLGLVIPAYAACAGLLLERNDVEEDENGTVEL